MRTPSVNSSAAAAEPVTAESLGWQLRAALPPLRLHSVSLYDREASVLWLSEGALGPDEHNLVVEAMDALASDTSQSCYELGMEDGRVAIFLPVRAPKGDLVGLSMILADLKSVGEGVLERIVTPQLRTIMQKIAVLLRASAVKAGATESVPILDMAPDAFSETAIIAAAQAVVPPAATPPTNVPPARSAAPEVLSAQAVDDILEFELTPDAPRAGMPPAEAPPAMAPPAETARLEPVRHVSPAVELAPTGEAGTESVTQEIFILSLDGEGEEAGAPQPGAPQPGAPQAAAVQIPVAKPAAPAETAQPPVLAPEPASTRAVTPPMESAFIQASSPSGQTSSVKRMAAASATSTSQVLALSATASSNIAAAANGTGTSKSLHAGSATGSSRVLSANDSAGMLLEVQPYVKLRAGGRSRRYEVLVRTSHRDAGALDAHALQRLLSWLSVNRGAWNLEPTTFTLNLSITTLEDERFPQNVASALKSHGVSPETIGFEIAEPLCVQRRAQVERFITLCDKIGCFVVVDDFSFDSSVLPLLRSKALRLVKIDPKLTGVALKDKLSQALVVAIAQAVKVLGIHCSAKRVESQAALQWLTAIGCDFAQGAAASPLQSLDSLVPAARGGQGSELRG